jgi:hypothetical protein
MLAWPRVMNSLVFTASAPMTRPEKRAEMSSAVTTSRAYAGAAVPMPIRELVVSALKEHIAV